MDSTDPMISFVPCSVLCSVLVYIVNLSTESKFY